MSNDNIIDFPVSNPRSEAEQGLGYRPKEIYCRCISIEVSEYDRTVECQNCGATIDPFDWCLNQCRDWEYLDKRKQRKEAELIKSIDKLSDIKRQIANAKAQLKRAKYPPAEARAKVSAKGKEQLQQIIEGLD